MIKNLFYRWVDLNLTFCVAWNNVYIKLKNKMYPAVPFEPKSDDRLIVQENIHENKQNCFLFLSDK